MRWLLKSLVCGIFGHSYKIIEYCSSSINLSEERYISIDVCKRCGKLNIVEEIHRRWYDTQYGRVADLASTIIAISKDFYEERRDLRPLYVVG
jgi:hypothetical protein